MSNEPQFIVPTVNAPSTLALLNKSEIDQQITTAKSYPRSIKQFRDKTRELATLTEESAQGCIYALPRGGKVIEGASARFAEILMHTWGNVRAAARVVSEDGSFVVAQGVFHDLETNSFTSVDVKRRITNRSGKRFDDDMIGVTGNAACSIALRNAILKGIPKALWNDLYEEARRTVAGDVKTLATRRADLVTAFQIYGIDEARILKALDIKGLEDLNSNHLVILRGIYTAIKDEEVTPEEAFPAVEPPKAGAKEAGTDKPAETAKDPSKKAASSLDAMAAGGMKGAVSKAGTDKAATATDKKTDAIPASERILDDKVNEGDSKPAETTAPAAETTATAPAAITAEQIEAAEQAGARHSEAGKSLRGMPIEFKQVPELNAAFTKAFKATTRSSE